MHRYINEQSIHIYNSHKTNLKTFYLVSHPVVRVVINHMFTVEPEDVGWRFGELPERARESYGAALLYVPLWPADDLCDGLCSGGQVRSGRVFGGIYMCVGLGLYSQNVV